MISIAKNNNKGRKFLMPLESILSNKFIFILKQRISRTVFFTIFSLFQIIIISDSYAVNYHIAVNGKSIGDGSSNNPWNLETALSGTNGAPGDTLWLHGGVYKGLFVSNLKGSPGANIVLAQYPGEIAIIDGNMGIHTDGILVVKGSYTTYYGFQVINSSDKRISSYSGSNPSDIVVSTGIHIVGPYNKFINLIVRDVVGVAIGFWKASVNSEIYGNVIYNNGWQGPDRGHGHGIYAQNETGTKLIRDNIIFGGFGRGIQIYGVNGGLNGFDIDGNIIFNSGILAKYPSWNIIIGGESMADNIVIRNNLTYKTFSSSGINVQVHFSNTLNGTLGLHNNTFVGGDAILSVKNWKTVNFSGNTIYSKNKILEFSVNSTYLSTYKWNYNTYLTTNTSNSMSGLTFDNWKKAYNFDGASKLLTTKPSNEIIIKPNVYEKGTGTVIVYNHQGLTSVEVDLSKIVALGAEYEIRDVENYTGLPIITGKYNGGVLRLPMNLTTTAKPNGITNVPHSDIGFNVFLVRTTKASGSSAVIANNPPTLNIITDPAAINEDALSQTINLSGITAGAGESQTLNVTATSDNISLIPHPKVIYTSPSSSGSIVYQPTANRWGTATITVTVDDGSTTNNKITRTFQITVNPVNDSPTLNSLNNLNIAGNSSTQTVNLTGISAGTFENQKIAITASSNNTALIPHPTVVYTSPNTSGSILFAPLTDKSGTATITVRVTDDGSGTTPHVNTYTRSFTVTVGAIINVNKTPTLNVINNPTAINEDAPEQTINLSGISAGEGESQKLTVTATSDNITLIPDVIVQYSSPNTTGSLKYKPASNRSGTAKVTVTVNDGAAENNTVSKTFTITVNELNDAPQLNAISNISVPANSSTKSVSLSGINAGPFENQLITIKATSSNTALIPNPSINYSSSASTGTLNFTPVANQSGSAIITVEVRDNGSGTNPHVNLFIRKFTVSVIEPINKIPTLNLINNPAEINEDAPEQLINISGITAGEGEDQTLSVTATSDNTTLIQNLQVNYSSPQTTGSVSFKPAANRSGVANITVKVDDGSTINNIITRTFSVKVNPVNDAPTLNIIPNLALEINATPQTINLSGIAAGPYESQSLSIAATSNNTALIPNPVIEYSSPGTTGKLVFTPVANATGTAIISVKVTDNGSNIAPHVNQSTRSFTVVITGSVASLEVPTINNINDINDLLEDAPTQSIQLTGISAGSGDNKTLKISAFSDKAGIIPNPSIEYTAPNNFGILKFKPSANKSGSVNITVNVQNGSATHNLYSTTFKVNILPVNDAPTINALNDINVVENSAVQTIDLSGITAGPGETQELKVNIKSSNTTLFSTLSAVYTSPNTSGSIKLQPSPNTSGSAIITVRITDNGSNTAPHINYTERSFKVNVSSSVTEPEVTQLNLINTLNGQIISQLKSGNTFYTSELPPLNNLNIDALVNQQFEGSVVFGFKNNSRYSIENFPPYAIAGNTGARYHNWNKGLIVGNNTISASLYSNKGGKGTLGNTTTITITIIDDLANNAFNGNVSGLYLVNSENEEVIFELVDNMTIESNDLPVTLDKLNIKAVFDSESTGSVIFGHNENLRFNIENKAPYLLGGNTINNTSSWNGLSLGEHKITATAFSTLDGTGEAGISYSINFNIKNSSNPSRNKPQVLPISRSFPTNQNYQFRKEDFKTAFIDENGTRMAMIKIVTLPSSGVLYFKNEIVKEGEEIVPDDIKKLVYIPDNKDTKVDIFTWNGSNGSYYADEVAKIKLISLTEMQDQIKFELAKFWPNPTQDNISILLNAPNENLITIYINDVNGQLLKTFTSNVLVGKNELILNVDDLKRGIYTITLINQFDKINFKMIKND